MKNLNEIKNQIVSWVNAKTHRLNLEEKSTKQVAAEFNITTAEAYKVCSQLAKDKRITKLDPVNGDKFDCCGWIRNNDNNEY